MWLRVILADPEADAYFEVGQDLLVGLFKNSITDIFLTRLKFC
jgi:hypothetical protein